MISVEMNKVLFNANHKYVIQSEYVETVSDRNKQLVATAQKNLEGLGFIMDQAMVERLMHSKEGDIVATYKDLYAACKDQLGAEVANARIFHPGFPDSVMSMDETQLYLEQIYHYFNSYLLGNNWSPDEHAEHTELLELVERKPKIIVLGEEEDLDKLMKDRMFSNSSLSESKLEELRKYMNGSQKWQSWIADERIPNKENAAAITNMIYNNPVTSDKFKAKMLGFIMRDTTDVLRFAALLSNDKTYKRNDNIKWGDPERSNILRQESGKLVMRINNTPDLSGTVHFKLNNKEAKLIKGLLAECKDLYAGVWQHEKLFKQLGRAISMRDKTPERLKKAFDNLCHNIKLDEHGRHISNANIELEKADKALLNGDIKPVLNYAKNFPGAFSRNLLRFIDHAQDEVSKRMIIAAYGELAEKVPLREALKVLNYIKMQNEMESHVVRVAKTGKTLLVENNKDRNYSSEILSAAESSIMKAVEKQIGGIKTLGKVYIDPALDGIKLPENGERSASKGSTLTYGSTFKSNPECNIIRPFIWWTNTSHDSYNVDLDLSATAYNADFSQSTSIAYYNQRENFGCHSGDFVDGGPVNGNGVGEFVEIDKKKLVEAGYKYLVVSVHSYSNTPFDLMEHAKFGFMERTGEIERIEHREDAIFIMNGETYEPSTVTGHAIDLNSHATTTIPVIYDIENDRFMWIDREVPITRGGLINTANNEYRAGTADLINSLIHNPTPSMGQLFEVYARTCGERVDSIEEADTIFIRDEVDASDFPNAKKIVNSHEIDTIAANFLIPTAEDVFAIPEQEVAEIENNYSVEIVGDSEPEIGDED